MSSFLVPLDGSEASEQVLHLAIPLARALGSDIRLLHVVDTGGLPVTIEWEGEQKLDEIVRRQEEEAKRYLAGVVGRLEGSGVQATGEVVMGVPHAEIKARATAENTPIVAMTTHGRSGLARWILGSVADKMLRTCQRPLLLYHPGKDLPAGEAQIKAVLLPLDGTPESETAIATAVRVARAVDCPVLVARVASVYGFAFEPEDPQLAGHLLQAATGEAEEYLAATADRLRAEGIQVEKRLIVGDPASSVTEWAGTHPGGLIVMSTHSRTGFERALLGSVTDKVVRSGALPVLVVPQGGRPGASKTAASG